MDVLYYLFTDLLKLPMTESVIHKSIKQINKNQNFFLPAENQEELHKTQV